VNENVQEPLSEFTRSRVVTELRKYYKLSLPDADRWIFHSLITSTFFQEVAEP